MTHVTNYDHFIVHEGYDILNFDNPFADNIGLVYLQRGGEFLLDIPNVNLINLPVDHVDKDFVGLPATAAGKYLLFHQNLVLKFKYKIIFKKTKFLTGFGATNEPQNQSSQYLNYVTMDVISNDICNIFYDDTMTETKLCTNTVGGKSTCHGKSLSF